MGKNRINRQALKSGARISAPDVPPPKDDFAVPSFRSCEAGGDHCLSDWQKDELKQLVGFFRKLEQHTWPQIYASGGKGPNKAGLGYTPMKDHALPSTRPQSATPDATIFELRVTQAMRVFAYRERDRCNFLWFVRSHT